MMMGGAGGIIAAGPVCQDPRVLSLFLHCLGRLEGVRETWLYDDNTDPQSRQMVADFCAETGRRVLPRLSGLPPVPYRRAADAHIWTNDGFTRIARIKDSILQRFLETDAEALLLADSDLLLHPRTAAHLAGLNLAIVSEVFWTRWQAGQPLLPQVWDLQPGNVRAARFITQFRERGQYPVGGLGACTLIRRDVLERGVRFEAIPSLPFLGEDRHFCVRAQAAGAELWADTFYPPFHVYRDDQLEDARAWVDGGCDPVHLTGALDASWEAEFRAWFHGLTTAIRDYGDHHQYAGATEPWVSEWLGMFARILGAKTVVEIGTLLGRTTAEFAKHVPQVIGIDVRLRADAINRLAEFPNVRLIEGDGAASVRALADGSVDFAFIDDGHRYEDVRGQVEALWPKLAPGAVVAFHDALSSEEDYGVRRYLAERFPDALVLQTVPLTTQRITGLALVQKYSEVCCGS